MRAIFIFSLLFFAVGFLMASADYKCSGTRQIFSDQKSCQANCPNGSCDLVSGTNDGASGQFKNPLKSASFEALVQSLANWVAAIALPIAAMFIIYSGFLFVTAGGNEAKLKAAKTTFYWTIIGAAIVVGAWALATAIVNFARKL